MLKSNENEKWTSQWIHSTRESILKLKPAKASQKRKMYGYTHAVIMLFCFGVVLATIYSQQEPSRYTSSYASLINAIYFDKAAAAATPSDIWTWFGLLLHAIGGKTMDHIQSNCQYQTPHAQNITIDGASYTICNPELQFQACDNSHFQCINHMPRDVYLTGNHEVLTFAVFSQRSAPHFAVKKSAAQNITVRSNQIHALNAVKDEKLIQMCQAPWQQACVFRDAFAGEPGSTLNWVGTKFDDLYAFERETSFAYLFRESAEPVELYPCYAYDNNTMNNHENNINDHNSFPADVVPGYPGYNGSAADMVLEECEELTWVTSGYDIRVQCSKFYEQQPSATHAYLARSLGYENVKHMYNELFGCDEILKWDLVELHRVYVNAQRSLEARLKTDGSHGLFLDVSSQQAWIADSVHGELLLKAHDYIDSNTRSFHTYIVTRGLGNDELFYSMITAEFMLETSGYIEFDADVTFVPIMQYWYGTDGYEWRVTGVFITEILLLSIAILFMLREFYQLYVKHISKLIKSMSKKYSTPPVKPVSSENRSSEKPRAAKIEVTSSAANVDHLESVKSFSAEMNCEIEQLENVGNCGNEIGKHMFVKKKSKLPNFRASFRAMSSINEVVTDVDTTIASALSNLADFTPDEDVRHDMLDWSTIIVICIMASCRVHYVLDAMRLHEFIVGVDVSGEEFDGHLESLIFRFTSLRMQQRNCRYLMIALLFVTMMQFFRYMAFDKKLGIVTSTISSAAADLIPVLIIFFVVLCAYSALGSQIYGVQLPEFGTLGESMASLLVMLLGEYVVDVNPVETYIFFFSFVVLLVFILLNGAGSDLYRL